MISARTSSKFVVIRRIPLLGGPAVPPLRPPRLVCGSHLIKITRVAIQEPCQVDRQIDGDDLGVNLVPNTIGLEHDSHATLRGISREFFSSRVLSSISDRGRLKPFFLRARSFQFRLVDQRAHEFVLQSGNHIANERVIWVEAERELGFGDRFAERKDH
jgi:hypothetical protein